jgi:glutathione synthase/RimK-type ligase-like ATP-grasp enzyme
VLYILEYRRERVEDPFEFAGVITVNDGKMITRYKDKYAEAARKELSNIPPDLVAISQSSDELLVSRKSVIYSDDDIDTMYQDLLEAERRRGFI